MSYIAFVLFSFSSVQRTCTQLYKSQQTSLIVYLWCTYFLVAHKCTVEYSHDFWRLQDVELYDHEHLLPLNVHYRLDINAQNFPNHRPQLPKIDDEIENPQCNKVLYLLYETHLFFLVEHSSFQRNWITLKYFKPINYWRIESCNLQRIVHKVEAQATCTLNTFSAISYVTEEFCINALLATIWWKTFEISALTQNLRIKAIALMLCTHYWWN